MKLRLQAQLLGYAGLIPFIALSIGTWVELPIIQRPHYLLQAYAAVILSFMGAVHWGMVISVPSEEARAQLFASVVPPLLGWIALMLPQVIAYSLLTLSFIGLCFYDGIVSRKSALPSWYVPMRVVLTSIVVLCLVLAAFAAAGY
jgi:hypothetical protein